VTPSWLLVALLAQLPPTGYVSAFLDTLPNRDATELRTRAFAEETIDAGPHVRIAASGFVEALLADRRGTVTDVVVEPQDLEVTFRVRHLDLAVGLGRVVWGRLDEVQPTDVVNPLDASRFFFEGRSEARLSVPLIHTTLYAGDQASVEGVYVPFFRRGRFDRLDEPTSPFNVAPPVPFTDQTLPRTAGNGQGGVRVNLTTGRVDWSVSAYRGFRTFGLYSARGPQEIDRLYPRFTMIGADFEAVNGAWVVRGEAAAFVRDAFQAGGRPLVLEGHSFDAGAAVDRKAGSYRISGQVLVHREDYDSGGGRNVDGAVSDGRTDVSLIVSTDRSFAREKYQGRVFAVYDPNNGSGFVRVIGTVSLRDNLALEGSVGWFGGSGFDTIGRFADSDFLYVRLKYFF
jgi:hypothetical protein